ncbi:hypothetical protein LAUMK42_03724 [Mycobacterium persicum]|uniref:Uncharacterized protein n=2 Tax=Mycobacterium persicum TaxID=1487726 RepID=A0AB38UWJ3_9MYCO|nr:hypothetical protein B1T49_11575 [Mycobacterium persicum]VAZ84896.1 hypothetical protein LAUMK42_03724 [Mycobacterium persicum]
MTRRRVIFVDPDIWTTRKDRSMTENHTAPNHGDNRRAAALIAHRANGSIEGIDFVMRQSNQLNRSTQLLRATLNAYRHITGELRTDHALTAMAQFIELCAKGEEGAGTDIRRAAQAVIADVDHDLEAFNAILIEANNDDQAGGVMLGLLELYSALLPELATPYALQCLSQWTVRIAGHEDDETTGGGGSPS